MTRIVESSACSAYGNTSPSIIFHLYFLALLLSALQTQTEHGSWDGSLGCSHDLGVDWVFDFELDFEPMPKARPT